MTAGNEPAPGAPYVATPTAQPAVTPPAGAPPAVPRARLRALRPAPGETAAVARLGLVCLLGGIPIGVLWWLVSPRRSYRVSADGAFAIVPDSEAAVGSDGWFMVLTAAFALIAVVLAWRREAQRGPLMAVGLAVGVLLSGILAWQVGMLLGPRPSAAALKDLDTVVLGPLGLRAYGVLVVAPFLAVTGYLLAACFTPRDDLRRADAPRGHSVAAQPGGPPRSVG